MLYRHLVGWAVVFCCTTASYAASFTVTSNLDDGAGTLRAAMLTANSNGEPDTITFAPGTMNISLGGSLPQVTENDLTVDGTGSTVTISNQHAFVLMSVTGCAIRNLRMTSCVYGVQINGGSGNVVEGCTLQSNNFPCTIWNGSTGNAVRGCIIENNTNGLQLGTSATTASSNTIGGTTASQGNRISGHSTTTGITINSPALTGGSNGNIIIGNRIGVNAAGTAAQANSIGIDIQAGANNVIGGATAGERNVISGNAAGIQIRFLPATGNRVEGNYIGVAEDGITAIPNTVQGIRIRNSASQNVVGGATATHGNVIARNLIGVGVEGLAANRNSILRNSIYSNTNLGIQLTGGSNGGITAPVIAQVNPLTGTVATDGTVQLFADTASQGRIFVDSVTSSSGTFSSSASLLAYEGMNLTATVTDSNGNTSTFSATKFIDVTPPSGSISTADPIILDENVVIDVAPPTDNFTATASIQMRFSNDDATWSAWEPYAATKNWDLYFGVAPVGGVKTVYAQFRDTALNVSPSVTTTVEIDITPPTGGLSFGSAVVTNSAIVLNLDAPSDNNTASNDVEMRFSNDGVTWTPYETYAATKNWDLNTFLLDTSDGLRTPMLQLRDEAGNQSAVYSITVELDTTGPQVLSFTQIDVTPTTAPTVSFSLQFDEPVANFQTGANPVVDDLNLALSGPISGPVITNIVYNGANNFTITASTGSGSGFIDLELVDVGDLADDHGNQFVGAVSAGPYAIDRMAITTQPVGGTPTEEDPFTFTVVAENGLGLPHYEWRKNGVPIPGAPDSDTYTIPMLAMQDTGDYTVVVSDDYISIESDIARLDVQSRIPVAGGAGLAALAAALAAIAAAGLRRRK